LVFTEHEPAEALALLADDTIDLALIYDYDLAPCTFGPRVEVTPLWTAAWGLGVPAADPDPQGDAVALVRRYADHDWIVNSRGTADQEALAMLAALAGFTPRLSHRADSLDLLTDLVVAGLGVGLLPERPVPAPGVRILPLRRPAVRLRAHAAVARGRGSWAPLAVVLDRIVRG
jgi:DNA-binding transcriptional LysR family regulator